MKRLGIIFFIVILLVNSIGLFFCYLGEMIQDKSEAAEIILHHDFDESTLKIFTTANKDFQIIDGKELVSNGKMYDVVKSESSGNTTVYYVLDDAKESVAMQGISQLTDNVSHQNTANPVKTIVPDVLKYFNQDNSMDHSHIYIQTLNPLGFVDGVNHYQSPFQDITSPPPQYFLI
ncbi:MAG: hypothetical protein WCL14_12590 [Bacteroidota bacterium]